MPSIQELAVRNAGRGVSVYSPNRPVIRPSGTRANRGTAQRVLQGGQGGRVPGQFNATPSSGSTQFQGPRYRPPDQAGGGRGRTALDDILDSMSANDPQPQQEEGGWKGALGTVVNSLPFKAIMAPLNVLDIPRRAIVSSVNEVADAFNGGDASWDDWFDQVKDPAFGFGDVIGSTGNIWADRFIGFAGDVALDPLTYVAGAGVFSGTGRAARTRLAGLASSQGMSRETIESIGRFGLSGVDNATREKLRQASTLLGENIGEPILDRGYYLKTPFRSTAPTATSAGSFHRIPGTAALDRFISPVFARGRANLAESRLGTTLRNRLRTPEVLREATEKLVTGRGSMSFDDAAGIHFYVNAQRSLGNTATARFNAEATKLMGEFRGKQLNDMIELAETQGNTALNTLFGRASKFMQEAGINFYPRKNYVPHSMTQPALEWVGSNTPLANAFRKAVMPGLEIDDISPRLMERHLLPNTTHEIEGRTFNVTTGTIKDLNEEWARVFPELKFKLFDDEVSTIFAAYGRSLGDDIGRAGALKTLLGSKSRLVRRASDSDMVKTLLDEEKVALLNKEAASMMTEDLRSISDRIVKLKEAQVNDTMGLQGVVGVFARETLDEVENLESGLKSELDDLLAQETQISHEMGRVSQMTGLPPPTTTGILESKLEMAFDSLEVKALASDKRLADLQDQAAVELLQWQSLRAMAGFDAGMMTVPEQYAALRAWNMAVAEAASISMDREAVQAVRKEVAEAIRKADLLDGMADDPAMAGRIAGVPSPREEWHASVPQRISADGHIVHGPAPSARGGKPITAPTGRIVPWDPNKGVDRAVADATTSRQQLIEGAEEVTGPRQAYGYEPHPDALPGKGEPVRVRKEGWKYVDNPRYGQPVDQNYWQKLGLEPPAREPKRIRVPLEPGAEDVRRARIPSAAEVQARQIEEAQLKQEEIAGRMLEPEEELSLRTERDEVAFEIELFEDSDVGRQLVVDQEQLAEAQGRLTNAKNAIERTTPERQVGRAMETQFPQMQELIRARSGLTDQVAEAKAALAAATGDAARTKAQTRLQRAQTRLRQTNKKIDAATNEPSMEQQTMETIAANATEQRDVLQQQVTDLQQRVDQGMAGRAALDQRATEIDEALAANTDLGRQLGEINVPSPADMDALRALNNRVIDKQAELAAAEKRVWDMSDLHANRVEEAGERVQLARNVEQDLLRRENEAWATPAMKDRLKAARAAVKTHRDTELHQSMQLYEAAQKPIKHAVKRRDDIATELESLKRTLADGPSTPDALRNQFARVNERERLAVQQARGTGDPVRTEFATFPQVRTFGPSRRNVYTDAQRDRLNDLYRIVNSTHQIDRAGGQSAQLVRRARKTIRDIAQRGGPNGPREENALIEARQIVLANHGRPLGTQAHKRYRAALKEINEIEAEVTGGVTLAQQEFGDVLRINDMLDELEQARTPLKLPSRGTKKYKAVALSPRGPGGDTSMPGRHKVNHDLARDWIENYSQDLIDRGAIDSSHVEFIRRQADELKVLLDAYGERPTPDLQSTLNQVGGDLGRMVDVMLSYRNAISANYEPSAQVGASIAAHRIMRERSTLDETIGGLEELLLDTPAGRQKKFADTVASKERKIADEQEIIDDPDVDDVTRRRAVGRRDATRRALRKIRDKGPAGEKDNPIYQGLVEDEIDTMANMVDEAVGQYLDDMANVRGIQDWRGIYTSPIAKKIEYEDNVTRYAGEIAEGQAAHDRLKQSIANAKKAGRTTVGYTPWRWRTTSKVSIEEAERRLASGEIPKYVSATVRTRIAKKRAAYQQAINNGKKPPEMVIDYSFMNKADRKITYTIEEAEAELAKSAEYVATKETSARRNQHFLDAVNGENEKRIAEIQAVLGDVDAPLNEMGVRTLSDEARKIRFEAERRTGGSLAEKLTPEEKRRLQVLDARIEQSTSPIDEERLAALNDELAERIEVRDEHQVNMVYDTELINNVSDNGHRMLRELVDGLRSPTKAEARLIRLLMGPENGELNIMVFRALDDYIADKANLSDETLQEALDVIREVTGGRRAGDDGLDRLLPADQAGRSLNYRELIEGTQASAEVVTIMRGAGRGTTTTLDANGFKEDFFQVLIAQVEAHLSRSRKELRNLLSVLDIQIDPGFELGGFINKRLGGGIKEYTKKQETALRVSDQVIHPASVRRTQQIRKVVADAMKRQGYDPQLSIERRLREAKAQRSRLNTYLRGLGMIIETEGIEDFDGFQRWWDQASLGQLDSAGNLDQVMATLRAPGEIEDIAGARQRQVIRRMKAAEKAGNTDEAAALRTELETLSSGRYLEGPPDLEAPPTPAESIAAGVEPERRPADPSERAVNQVDEQVDPEEVTQLQTELEQLRAREREANEELGNKQAQLRAIETEMPKEAEAPASATFSELETLVEERRAATPEDFASRAEVNLAVQRYAAYVDSLPDNMTPQQEARMTEMSDEVAALDARKWPAEPKREQARADRIADAVAIGRRPQEEVPLDPDELIDEIAGGGGVERAIGADAEAESINAMTKLRGEINALDSELDGISDKSNAIQRRLSDLEKDHSTTLPASQMDDAVDSPSMLDDPISAEQAEGLPPEGMSPETAPSHLVDDHIFDADASPEDLARELETVVSQSRALLQQYGSFKAMPPDVQKTVGELANRAKAIGQRRAETFEHATKNLPPGDKKRLVAALQSAGQASEPRVDLDWWTVISTGTPPAGVSTRLAGRTGVSSANKIPKLRRTALERGELRGAGGSRFKGSLKIKERILRGETAPTTRVSRITGKYIKSNFGQTNIRPLTDLERRAGQREVVTQGRRDLQAMAERADTEAAEKIGRLNEAEAQLAELQATRMEGIGRVAEMAAERRTDAMVEQRQRLIHANDELTQEQRRRARLDNGRARVSDAYTRALETRNNQLGDVRRRVIETQIDHQSAARHLELLTGSLREPKDANVKQIWTDMKDLVGFKQSQGIGTPPASAVPAPEIGPGLPPPTGSATPEIRQIEALLSAAWDQQRKIDDMGIHHDLISKRLKDFENAPKKNAFYTPEQLLSDEKYVKAFPDVFIHQVADGWQAIAEDMFTGPDALVIADSLKRAMDNIRRTTREPGFWKMIEKYTAFFSTYATMKPGFHVRNAMSGTFMNMVDGVKIRNMRKAPGIWRDFMKDPEGFWARTGAEADRHRTALMAVFGSGATGQFGERGLTEAATTGSKLYRLVMNNGLTRLNRKAGAYVEGPMRLAMALDSVEKGLSLGAALDRITKFHFDYTQLSEMDVVARRMVPFWTFMSRNLPLQIESMWLRPRTYLQYQSVVRNFGEEMHPLTPEYWLGQGVFTVDENAPEREAPWYLAPDLPHLRIAEPATALAQGDLGRAVLSDINPLFLAPIEAFAAGKKFYTGGQISDEYREPTSAEEKLMPLFQLLGGTEAGASGEQVIDPRYAHVASSTLPPLEFLNRLLSNEGTRAGRQGETIARSLGAPVYKLTPELQQATRRNQYYDRLDERERQAQLARL